MNYTNSTGSFCCACNGVCNHVGPHSYCEHHSPKNQTPTPITIIMPGNLNPGTFHSIDPRVTELLEEVKKLRIEIKELKENSLTKPDRVIRPNPDIPSSKYPPYYPHLRIQKTKDKK